MDKNLETQRPRMLISTEGGDGRRSLDQLREANRSGHTARLWSALREKVDRELDSAPWTPQTALPERQQKHRRHGNREYVIVGVTANRILDGALVALVEGSREHADGVLRQVDAIYDEAQWPELDDITHLRLGDHCSLRRGQFAASLGLAYDWLAPLLNSSERQWWCEGFSRRLAGPFCRGVEADDRWTGFMNNFITTIYGGFGVAAMSFGNELPAASWIVQVCHRAMETYLEQLLGPEGEFDESVQYSGSVNGVLRYLAVRRDAEGTGDTLYRRYRLDAFGRWYACCCLPPGRVIGFGDPGATMPPVAPIFGHLAGAVQDPVLQWFYLQYANTALATHRKRAEELLAFDPTLESVSPEGEWPRGYAFSGGAQIVVSRSDWDATTPRSVAYGKGGLEPKHAHADWGQLCLDAFGERLLIDLGSTGGYPWGPQFPYFYNFQQWGHNVLVIGENETGGVSMKTHDEHDNPLQGRLEHAEFDERLGGTWSIDLGPVYGAPVKRRVAHLLPDVVVVLDEAALESREHISLRWHCGTVPGWDETGRFTLAAERGAVAGRVMRLDGSASLRLDHHRYEPPYDHDRLGEPYTQRHEPFLALETEDRAIRFLSLFAVYESGSAAPSWESTSTGWGVETSAGSISVNEEDGRIAVRDTASGSGWVLGGGKLSSG